MTDPLDGYRRNPPREPAVDGDTLQRLVAEITNGTPPEQSRIPDSPAVRAARAKLKAEIDAMPEGSIVHIPSELPPLDI